MKTIVIYNSQTGFTKRYAEWIAEETGGDLLELSAAKKNSFDEYDAIIFGSWACAGTVNKLNWFKNNAENRTDKKLIVFCVGGSPADSSSIEQFLNRNFSDMKNVNAFYCPGGFNYDKMSAPSKLMMNMFLKMLKNKKIKTKEEEEMEKMISSSYDISDRKYIEPILECLNK